MLLCSCIFIIIMYLHCIYCQNCPCQNVSLCNNIKTEYSKELFGFGANNETLPYYNWTYITTMAWAKENQTDLLCTGIIFHNFLFHFMGHESLISLFILPECGKHKFIVILCMYTYDMTICM